MSQNYDHATSLSVSHKHTITVYLFIFIIFVWKIIEQILSPTNGYEHPTFQANSTSYQFCSSHFSGTCSQFLESSNPLALLFYLREILNEVPMLEMSWMRHQIIRFIESVATHQRTNEMVCFIKGTYGTKTVCLMIRENTLSPLRCFLF